MKSYVIDIDSMNEDDYSRARQLFDLLALTIGCGDVADAIIVSVPDEIAPVVVRVAGELGAVWYPLVRNPEDERIEEKIIETVVYIAPTKAAEQVGTQCKYCGEPIRTGSIICGKPDCKRAYGREWYQEHKGKKIVGGDHSGHDPFGQMQQVDGDQLSGEVD